MYNFQTKKMKNLIFKTATTISVFSASLFNTNYILGEGETEQGYVYGNVYQYGSNSTRPDSFKVVFYQLGLANSDFTKVFSVLDSESGVEVDISDQNSINNLAAGVTPVVGTYTHIYGLISNTYKIKGSANGCYTKNTSTNMANSVFDADIWYKNGVAFPPDLVNKFDGWPAATSNQSEAGEATITEQAFGVNEFGEPDNVTDYGPVNPLTNISISGNGALSVKLYLTNSSSPYTYVPPDTPVGNLPQSSTRDRALYVGKLSSSVVVEDNSKGVVQLYFDFSNGLGFDDDCDSIKINSGDFDMTVVTE